MYSTHNEGNSGKNLKNKIHICMTSISKNNEYNNTYQSTIKMKPVDVKSSIYIDFHVEKNIKDPKFEVDNSVRISKYKNIFAKGYAPNRYKEFFVIKKLKILCQGFI